MAKTASTSIRTRTRAERTDAARRAVEERQQLKLTVRDSEAFIDALLNPRPVNDRLRETIRRYREKTGV